MAETITRSYSARVRIHEADVMATHQRAVHTVMAETASRSAQLVAVRTDAFAARFDPDADLETRVAAAAVIALGWWSSEPETLAPPERIVTDPDEMLRRTAGYATAAGLAPAATGVLLENVAAVFGARTRAGTVWVDYRAGGEQVPTVGWAALADRLVGTLDKAATGDLTPLVASFLSQGLGSGTKTDPAVVLERARACATAAADPAVTTVRAFVRTASQGACNDIESFTAWLRDGVLGASPAIVTRLRKHPEHRELSGAHNRTGTVTVRDALADAAARWETTWSARAIAERDAAAAHAAGVPTAGDWIAQAVRLGMPDAAYRSGPWTDMIGQAASLLATHRAKVHQRADEWAAAAAAERDAIAGADADLLALVDNWITDQPWYEDGPAHLPRRGTRAWPDVLRIWRTMPTASTATLLAAAADADALWAPWWAFVAEHRDLWTSADTFVKLRAVYDARWKRTHLAAPTYTRPDPDHPARGTWFGSSSGVWPGQVAATGAITMTVWDGTDYRFVTGTWTSKRVRRALRPGIVAPAGSVLVTRDDPRARVAAGASRDPGVSVQVTAAPLVKSSFTLRTDPSGRIRTYIAVAHTPPRDARSPLPDERIVAGVHFGQRSDATCAIWRTVLPVGLRDQTDDTATVQLADPVTGALTWRHACRVGPPGGIEWATQHQVATIDLTDEGRWAPPAAINAVLRITGWLANVRGVPSLEALATADGSVRLAALLGPTYRLLSAAMRAQRDLAEIVAETGTGDPREHPLWPALTTSWPVEADTDLDLVWHLRDGLVRRSLQMLRADVVFTWQRLGPSLTRVQQLDRLYRLIATYYRRPTPSRRTAIPAGTRDTVELAGRVMRKRTRVRDSWARLLASRIVDFAVEHGAHVLAVPELTGPLPDAGRFDAAANARLALWAHRAVVAQLESLAPLHGLLLAEVSRVSGRWIPSIAQRAMPIWSTNLSALTRLPDDSVWRREVRYATVDLTHEDPLIRRRAQLVLEANKRIAAVVGDLKTAPDRARWHQRARGVRCAVPHPWGAHVAAIETAELVDLPDGRGWKMPHLIGSDHNGAQATARAGVRRHIRQGNGNTDRQAVPTEVR